MRQHGWFFFALLLSAISGDSFRLLADTPIPIDSKVFISPMNGFENYLMAAFTAKKVPLVIVTDRGKADFVISGVSESERPLFESQTDERATIVVTDIRTGVVAFAYAAHIDSAYRGRQTAAESCAKHLKEKIERDQKTGTTVPPSPPATVAADSLSKEPPTSAAAPTTTGARVLKVRVQGDLTAGEFLENLRRAFAANSFRLEFVEPGTDYDYNIILTVESTNTGPAASAIALDQKGRLVASAARSGFRVSGAASACATELAKRMAAMLGSR